MPTNQREHCHIELCGEVAERRLAEQRLHERERHYREIFHNISDCVCLVDVLEDGRFRYLETNRAFDALMGVPEDVMRGQYVGDLLLSSGADAMADKVITKLRRCLEAGSLIDEEITLDLQSDRRIFQTTLTPLFDNSGRIRRILAISRDITERKRAEQQIGFMNFTLDQLHEAVFLVDPQAGFRFRYVNDRACQSLGYSRDELLNMIVPDIDPCVDLVAAQKIDEQLRQQLFTRFETFHRTKGGHIFPVEISASELEYDGQLMGLSVVRDITEHKHMEMERLSHLCYFENMDRINRAIQGSNDLETVMNNVLDTVLSIFDCDRAFLIDSCYPEANSWSVPFERTRPEYADSLALGLVTPMDEEDATTFRIMLDSGGPITYGPGNQHPLPKEVSEKFGFKSLMSMAVHPKGSKPWHFGIHQCSRVRVWMPDERKLLQEISRRLADSLSSLLAYRNTQEREQKFRTLAESLPDYIARYDLQVRKTYVNPRLGQLLGTCVEAWLGKTPREIYLNGELDEYQAKLENVIKTGKCDEMERIAPDGNGGWQYTHIRFAAERGPNGEIVGALAMGRDVTRKRQLEQELIQREREFRTLAENSPDVIVRYDRNCRRTYVNRAYKVLTNTMEGEALGTLPREYWRLAMPNADEYTKILQRVIKTRTQERIEVQLVDAAGMLRYYSMHLVPEPGDNDEVTSVLSISNDITDLKTAEQRREETSKQAERQLREFSAHLQAVREEEKAFMAREIHDNLGGTLTALKMDLNWLLDELSANKEATSVLNHVESMSQLLDNAAVVTRRVITDLRPTILDDFGLLAALEWQAEQFQKRTGIQCRVACDENDPYESDKTQTINLFRIFQESLTNVTRHSGASRVEVKLQYENQKVIMTINDNGCGRQEGHIVSPTSYGMLGMRERAKQLGGRINFYSPPGGGFSVTVTLPRFIDDKNKGKT
ncbi:PAS domain S-box protein [Methylobacter sp. YRD-M1]|nr:PAS domain S-box protein [Methylobacter sp. YRD-M1]